MNFSLRHAYNNGIKLRIFLTKQMLQFFKKWSNSLKLLDLGRLKNHLKIKHEWNFQNNIIGSCSNVKKNLTEP